MNARRLTLATLATLCALAACLLGSVSALALSTRVISSTFGSSGAGSGQVSSPAGLAVNSTTHDVYVADTGNHRIDEFEADGTFLRAWGWGVGDGLSPEPQTCTITCFAGLSGSGPGEFESPTFVAVDNSAGPSKGDVYVGDTGDGVVTKFSESGVLIESWGTKGQLNGSTTLAGSFGALAGIAVGSAGTGTLYVLNTAKALSEFGQDGAFTGTEFEVERGTNPGGLAVNAAGEIFKVNGDGSVEEITGADGDVGQATPGGSQGAERATELAIEGPDLYVAAPAGVRLFDFTAPGVVSEPGGSTCTVAPAAPCGATESFGANLLSGGSGIGVNSSTGEVYVVDATAERVDVFTAAPVILPDVSTEPVSSVKELSATLNGTVNPDEAGEAKCRFEWGTTTGFGKVAACEPEGVASGPSPVAVHAALSGLQPNTTYHYRLQAGNVNGTNFGEVSQDREFTTASPAALNGTESVSNVASTSATLDAGIELHGTPTSYYFQYGPSPAYGADVPAAPGVPLGDGVGEVAVSQHLQGLSTDTTYHYRIVLVEELEVSPGVFKTAELEGHDETFTTQGSGGTLVLPDGREWEMVSQPNKLGALLYPLNGFLPLQASLAGDAITYAASAPTEPEPAGNASFGVHVLSVHGASGWSSRDLSIPNPRSTGLTSLYLEYPYFSEDLSSALVQPLGGFDPSLSTEASEQTAYVQSNFASGDTGDPCTSGCFRPLVTGAKGFANVPEGTEFGVCVLGGCSGHCPPEPVCGPQFRAASPDLSHIVLRSTVGLTEHSGGGLYEWSGGQLTFVGTGFVGGTLPREESQKSVRHAVSADGSRVVIYGEYEGMSGLLLRDTASGETVQLGGAEADFQTASADDSKIFFVENEGLDECEIVEVAGKLQCGLTGSPAKPAPVVLTPGANVLAPVVGASEDGSTVYFVSNGILTGAERNGRGEAAVAGDCQGEQPPPGEMCNLYVSHDEAGTWTTKLIAVLASEDSPDWGNDRDLSGLRFPAEALQKLTARVSPDGRWLAFMSQRSLTGYDNEDVTGAGRRDEEVYLYDAETAKVVCVSCDPTGARPHGVEYANLNREPAGGINVWERTQWIAANIPGWTTEFYQSRYLSDGGRLFFNSSDALVPQDTNKTEDVYEYEPPVGAGGGTESPANDTCTTSSATYSPASEGCVGLISSGSSPGQSGFLDASENGDDVFFITTAQLSARDVDQSFDVYDARVGGGEAAVVKPVECQGDACQTPVTPSENLTPGSLTFHGPGNPTSTPSSSSPPAVKSKAKVVKCKKGYIKKKVKKKEECVKVKSKKMTRAKKASNDRRTSR
jgi:DNA-binding beta-propeller fold protein YncE